MSLFDWIDFLNELSEKELNTLSLFCQLRKLKEEDMLFEQWEDAISMYILKKWLLQAYKMKWTKKHVLGLITSWEIFWEISIFWGSFSITFLFNSSSSEV